MDRQTGIFTLCGLYEIKKYALWTRAACERRKEKLRKYLTILSVSLMTAVMLSGCSSDTKTTLADDTVTIEEEQPAEEVIEESVEETVEPEEEPVEETAEEPEEEPAKDWFKEHELVITPQGDFAFTTMAYVFDSNDNKEDVGTFEVIADAVIMETTDGVEDGYKEVTMVWNCDMSGCEDVGKNAGYGAVYGTGYRDWFSAFDRYTGTSFEFDSLYITTYIDETSQKEGFVTIVNGDESYDVSISFETVNNWPDITDMITVTCPVDYDGVVFQIGYNDLELRAANQEIDYTARLYTIDELPYYGEGYYYFSYSDE